MCSRSPSAPRPPTLVTTNIRDFPVRSRPAGVAVVTADRFLRDQLGRAPELVVEAVEGMSQRLKSPPQSPADIAAVRRRAERATVRS